MPNYPAILQYPITRSVTFQTRVVIHEDTTEQRWPLVVGSESLALNHSNLTLAERDLLIACFEDATGDHDQTVDVLLGAEALNGYHFEGGELSFTERKPGRWETQVTLRKVARAADLGALAADFPVLASGARVQLPYTHGRGFDNVIVRTEGGRYEHARRATSLRTWSAGGPCLSSADALAIWNHFSRARGRWKAFGFTDADSGVRYASCRFASDTLEWRYVGPGHHAVETRIQQIA